jgi:hypothetical protein
LGSLVDDIIGIIQSEDGGTICADFLGRLV